MLLPERITATGTNPGAVNNSESIPNPISWNSFVLNVHIAVYDQLQNTFFPFILAAVSIIIPRSCDEASVFVPIPYKEIGTLTPGFQADHIRFGGNKQSNSCFPFNLGQRVSTEVP